MNTLNESTAKRIGKLIRMFSSPFEPERLAAFRKLIRLLIDEGLSSSDLATVIENAAGSEIEELRYSDSDMASVAERMKERGQREGPRFRALALLGRRLNKRAATMSMPASEKPVQQRAFCPN